MTGSFHPLVLSLLFVSGCEKQPTGDSPNSNEPKQPLAGVWLTRSFLEKAEDDPLQNGLQACLFNIVKRDFSKEVDFVRSWTPGKRMLYTSMSFEAEVNNGGFVQYFWNSEGKLAAMTVEGLLLIGADKHADILKRAIEIHTQELKKGWYPPWRPVEDEHSYHFVEENSALPSLDVSLYELTEDLAALRVKFIREHLDEFATPS